MQKSRIDRIVSNRIHRTLSGKAIWNLKLNTMSEKRNERRKTPRSKKYQDWLVDSLKDPKEAAAYLNAALEDCFKEEPDAPKIFLTALRNVAEAQGGLSKLARKTHLGRESLYKTLSASGNPAFTTLIALFSGMGLHIKFT